jgi:Acyl-CoA reductase (LuxC)
MSTSAPDQATTTADAAASASAPPPGSSEAAPMVSLWVPERAEVPLASVLASLSAAPPSHPFADDALELLDRFSRRLLADPISRAHPELMTLGFFTRKAEVQRAKAERLAAARPELVEVPLGLVFHVPPANVDTIFMYSWVQSLLAGNANLVRLSARRSPVVDHLCELLCELLAAPELAALRARVAMLHYGHDDAITAAISARCALRVIWGGDAAVSAIRRAPLPPGARDLPFADRYSLLALGAAAVAEASAAELATLVERLFNDLYWFDQAGCSSPRLCLWVGPRVAAEAARARLWPALAAFAEQRGYHPDVAMRLAKDVFCYRAVLDGTVVARAVYGPALTVLEVASLDGLGREHPGAGLLFEAVVDGLGALATWVTRKDQTLTHFGLPRDQLVALVQRLAGRGLDRVVPVGQALQMSRWWDGYDLASEMIRRVHVPA